MYIDAQAESLSNPRDPYWVLEDFCLQTDATRPILIEGASGVGKTTVLRFLMGDSSVKSERSSVTFTVNGQPLSAEIARMRRMFAYVGSEHPFLNWTSIGDGMEVLSKHFGSPFYSSSKQAQANIDRLKLTSSHLRKRPHEVSFGERRRLSILFSTMMRPKIFIVDEIFNGLDDESCGVIANFMLNAEEIAESILIMTSHEPRLLAGLNVFRFRVDPVVSLSEQRKTRFYRVQA